MSYAVSTAIMLWKIVSLQQNFPVFGHQQANDDYTKSDHVLYNIALWKIYFNNISSNNVIKNNRLHLLRSFKTWKANHLGGILKTTCLLLSKIHSLG